MIKITLKRIHSILQEKKSLQVWQKKLGQALKIIAKMSKDLGVKENMVRGGKNNIEKLDRRITEIQNLFTYLPNIFHSTFATVTRPIANIV